MIEVCSFHVCYDYDDFLLSVSSSDYCGITLVVYRISLDENTTKLKYAFMKPMLHARPDSDQEKNSFKFYRLHFSLEELLFFKILLLHTRTKSSIALKSCILFTFEISKLS